VYQETYGFLFLSFSVHVVSASLFFWVGGLSGLSLLLSSFFKAGIRPDFSHLKQQTFSVPSSGSFLPSSNDHHALSLANAL